MNASLFHRLLTLLPDRPGYRHNIFCGANSRSEWWLMARQILLRLPVDDDHSLHSYEKQFCQQVNGVEAFSFGAGRMAFHALLEAMEIGPGDEVILPAFTCVVVPNAILYRGARPVYVDIESDTFNIDPQKIEAAITPRTKLLYAQHTFGIPCDLKSICQLGKRYDIPVLEDCGHALGAQYRGQAVGSQTEAAYFTTDHSKTINTHLGGMAVANTPEIANKVREVQQRSTFLSPGQQRRLMLSFLMELPLFSPYLYWIGRPVHLILSRLRLFFYFRDENKIHKPTQYPYPSRLSAHQANLGISQLEALQGNLAHRRKIAWMLEERFGWFGHDKEKSDQGGWLRYPMLVQDQDAFQKRLMKRFDLGIWFTSVTGGREENLHEVGYTMGQCPVAEKVCRHIVNIPTHPRIPIAHIEKLLNEHGDWIKGQMIRLPQ